MWPLIQVGAAAGTEPLAVLAAVCRHRHLEQQRLASLFSKIELAAVVEAHLVIALEELLLAAIRTASSIREYAQLDVERLLKTPQAAHALEPCLGVKPPLERDLVAATLGIQHRGDLAGPKLRRQVERGGWGASLEPAVSLGQSRQVDDKSGHMYFRRQWTGTGRTVAQPFRPRPVAVRPATCAGEGGQVGSAQRVAALRPKKIPSSRSALGTLSEAWTEFICLLSP